MICTSQEQMSLYGQSTLHHSFSVVVAQEVDTLFQLDPGPLPITSVTNSCFQVRGTREAPAQCINVSVR